MRNEVKLILGAVLSIAVGNAVLLYALTGLLDRHAEAQLDRLREEKNADILNELRGRVETAHSVVEHLAATVPDEAEAKRRSMAAVSAMRFGEDNYIWIHRLDPARASSAFMLVHAADDLVGKDLSGWIDLERIERIHFRGKIYDKDAPEVAHIAPTDIFATANRICLRDGEGSLAYYWPKVINGKATPEGYRKLSYVKYFPKWRWVIGAGAYADHIDAVVGARAAELSAAHHALLRKVVVAFVLLSLVVIAVVALMIRRLVLRPLYLRLSQTNRELQEACEAAAAATEAKSEFLANMSHEIRTPLNGVLATAELLQHTELTDKQRRYADTLLRSGRGLLTVISDILDFSKIEAGKLRLELAPFQPRAVVFEVAELFSGEAEKKQVSLESRVCEQASGWFVGDSARLRQILVNLVGNAVKFTDQGRIEIAVESVAESDASVTFSISVSDTGIGIDDRQKERLFSRFEQADTTTTRRYGGTGLGLALSRQLVELMGGEISVTSEPGKGSTFRVAVRLERTAEISECSEERSRSSRDAAVEVAEPGSSMRVLLVEDNAVNREIAEELLALLGVHVEVARSGQEALDRLQASAPSAYDLLFMDCHMPGMDGFEATRRIREREQPGEHLPIVAMSASATVEDRQRCTAVGMDDFLAKPIYLDALRDMVQKHGVGGGEEPARDTDATPPRRGPVPVFDRATALRIVGGNASLLQRVVAAFEAELPAQVEKLEQAMEARDFPGARQLAHSVKGAAMSVAATELRALAERIERAATDEDPAELERLSPDLGPCATRLVDALSNSDFSS